MKKASLILILVLVLATNNISISSERPVDIISSILEKDSKKNENVGEKTPYEKDKIKKRKADINQNRTIDNKKESKVEKPTAAPSPDMMLFKTGVQLFNSSLFEASLKKFSKLKTEYPQSPLRDIATVWSGKISLKLNKADDAIKAFNSISENSGEFPSALYFLGEAELRRGSKIEAIEYFYKLSSQFPEYELADKALIKLTKIYISEGKGDQSLESAVKIIKNYPERDTVDDAYYYIGKVFEKDPVLKDIEIARKIYKIFLDKAKDMKNKHFWNSPLKKRVKRDLRYIEKTYFKMED